MANAGGRALGTASWSVAAAHGFADGERIPREVVVDTARRIAQSIDLPLTVDIESGFGEEPEDVAATVRLIIGAGAVGRNLEDSRPTSGKLRTAKDAAARIRAARSVADELLPEFFINARTDVFFEPAAGQEDRLMIAEALSRAAAYADAGADGLFAPGLSRLPVIGELAGRSPLPLNVMRFDAALSISELAQAGVARISHGPHPYLVAMAAIEQAAGELVSTAP